MRQNKRIVASIVWIVLGLVLTGCGIAGIVDSYWSGMGGGLLAVGILQMIRHIRYRTNETYRETVNTAVQDEFMSCNVYARPECRDCWARLYCSGGCAANAYHATGSVRGIYKYGCELFKKRMECAIAVAVSREFDGQ